MLPRSGRGRATFCGSPRRADGTGRTRLDRLFKNVRSQENLAAEVIAWLPESRLLPELDTPLNGPRSAAGSGDYRLAT